MLGRGTRCPCTSPMWISVSSAASTGAVNSARANVSNSFCSNSFCDHTDRRSVFSSRFLPGLDFKNAITRDLPQSSFSLIRFRQSFDPTRCLTCSVLLSTPIPGKRSLSVWLQTADAEVGKHDGIVSGSKQQGGLRVTSIGHRLQHQPSRSDIAVLEKIDAALEQL